jgi:hypothetical protein
VTAVTLRPALFCVIADRHRDLRVAEDACVGRFTHCGRTLELGLPPNWSTAGLPDDPEWRIECSKFLWGLDLAHAHSTTGEARYRDAWELLVRSWIAQIPPRADATEVAARRLQNWVYAREAFGASPSLDDMLVERMADELAYVREHLTPARNHRTLELYGLFVAALGVPELDADGSLAVFALDELRANLEADFHPDGVHREASTHYHVLALRSLLATLENARRFGLDPGCRFEERLARAAEFLRHVRRPDGQLPALSDSDGGDHRDLLELAARLLERPDLRPDTGHASGSASFPHGGYFVQRSGWDREARYLVFDCGPLGDGGHGHYDALSVEIAAHGRPLVVDPGRFTYADEQELRRWFKGTAAHNTVTVDRTDQTPYSGGKPKGPVAEARAGARTIGRGLDVLRGEVRSPVYEAVHSRTIVFVDGAYWLVEDRLEGERTHRYDLRFHLAASSAGFDGRGRVRAAGVVIQVDGADEIGLERGWLAPTYGVRLDRVVVSAVRSARSAVFTTLVAPVRSSEPPRSLEVLAPGRAVVTTPEGRDVLSWTATAACRHREAV